MLGRMGEASSIGDVVVMPLVRRVPGTDASAFEMKK